MNLIPQLPAELNLKILKLAAGNSLAFYKKLRLVSKQVNFSATEFLLEGCLARLEARIAELQNTLSKCWNDHVTEREGKLLEDVFTDLSARADELNRLKAQFNDKKANRKQIASTLDWDRMPAATVDSIVRLASYSPEFLAARQLSENVNRQAEQLNQLARERQQRRAQPPYMPFDPLRVPPPLRPQGPPFAGGEPPPDHLTPPDWERDRNPAPFGPPGNTGADPFSPFGPFAPAGPGGLPRPRGPGRGGGGGGGGLNPFNPNPPSFGGPRFL